LCNACGIRHRKREKNKRANYLLSIAVSDGDGEGEVPTPECTLLAKRKLQDAEEPSNTPRNSTVSCEQVVPYEDLTRNECAPASPIEGVTRNVCAEASTQHQSEVHVKEQIESMQEHTKMLFGGGYASTLLATQLLFVYPVVNTVGLAVVPEWEWLSVCAHGSYSETQTPLPQLPLFPARWL
jgi:hypothetical protein